MRIALLSTSDTDLLQRAGVRRRLRPGQPVATRPPVDGRGDRGLRPRRRPAARLAAGPLLRLRPDPRDRHAGGRARRRAAAERRADGAVDGADRRRGRGAPLPRRGRSGNLAQLHAFLSDTVLLTGEGFEPPRVVAAVGLCQRRRPALDQRSLPRVGVLYYRAHEASGNTAFAHALADAIDATGQAVGVPVFAGSPALRARRALRRPRHARRADRHRARRRRQRAGRRERRRRRRGVGRRADGGARHPGPAGALPHQQPRRVGGLRRRRHPARLGHPDRDPGVRRADHHRAVLVQGDRRGRACRATSPTPSAAPGSPDRGQPRPAAARPDAESDASR